MSIKTSDTIKAIAAALLKFQGSVEGVSKTAENPAFKRGGKTLRYATLENVRDTAVPELQKVGIVFLQSAGAIVEDVMAMTTRLIHAESGEWIEGTMDIALGKRDPQGVGSASTYAARYSLMHMLGLPPIDDDGESAIDRTPKDSPAKPAQKPEEAFRRFEAAIPQAATEAALQAIYEQIDRTPVADLSQGDFETLSAMVTARLAELRKPTTKVAPNFDTMTPAQQHAAANLHRSLGS